VLFVTKLEKNLVAKKDAHFATRCINSYYVMPSVRSIISFKMVTYSRRIYVMRSFNRLRGEREIKELSVVGLNVLR
jgi:hypothetical protein